MGNRSGIVFFLDRSKAFFTPNSTKIFKVKKIFSPVIRILEMIWRVQDPYL